MAYRLQVTLMIKSCYTWWNLWWEIKSTSVVSFLSPSFGNIIIVAALWLCILLLYLITHSVTCIWMPISVLLLLLCLYISQVFFFCYFSCDMNYICCRKWINTVLLWIHDLICVNSVVCSALRCTGTLLLGLSCIASLRITLKKQCAKPKW